MKISVVAPLYRSAPYIEEPDARCVETIHSIDEDFEHEIVFVNDGSPGDDIAVAGRVAMRDPNVVVIDLARNYGQDRAVMVGLGAATGDLVFLMDSDLEDEPEWIALFYTEMLTSGCDVVYGVQANKKRGLRYRLGRGLFFRVMRRPAGSSSARTSWMRASCAGAMSMPFSSSRSVSSSSTASSLCAGSRRCR